MSSLIVPVVKISSITKHPNADSLLIVRFDGFGWQSIVNVSQDFMVGDVVVFVPPDCILPENIIELEKIGYLKDNKGRTRTVKLRKELSEGIVIPTTIFSRLGIRYVAVPGENVAGLLGIEKYEPPAPKYQQTGPKPKKDRPYNSKDFPKYTDIENVKNFWAIFMTLVDARIQVRITEKIHGTNFRAGWVKKTRLNLWDRVKQLFGKYDPWVFTCGSRNVEMGIEKEHSTFYAGLGENIYQKIARQIRYKIPKGFIVYGEIFGEGIQDLTYGIKGIDFKIFDIMKSDTLTYVDYFYAKTLCDDWFKNEDRWVPVLYIGYAKPDVVTALSNTVSVLAHEHGVDQLAEGCVVAPLNERYDPVMGRMVFKAINPDYLVRNKGTEFK